MNILVPHSWLKDFLETKAIPRKIAECLSLCGPSVEKLEKVNEDWLYEIEVTTNRPDCLGIMGIAREAAVILPRFGIKARFKKFQIPHSKFQIPQNPLPLELKIQNSSLCPRFTAIILDNITIKRSPKKIQKRLQKCGIRALNNIVDITNYLMLELSQPMHSFDYDKIKGHKMTLRKSKEGEEITTLDGVRRTLPEGTIVIEDGKQRLIDLCGIMGGKNSEIDEETKRVLLFVQTYNPIFIRKTSQVLGLRTEASARFEKGLDPEMVIPGIKRAVRLIEQLAGGEIASELIDIYPNPPKPKMVKISLRLIEKQLGMKISLKEVVGILKSLGFEILNQARETITVQIPSWRADDVSIPEDLIEEVARIYGYHRLPSLLPTGEFPKPVFEKIFSREEKIKDSLKDWGFTEVYTYSMQSLDLIKKTGLNPERCLRLKNPLTHELEYMRTSLIPSILQVIAENQDNFETIKIFELANIYLPRKNKLPEERPILIGAIIGKNKFYEVKGVVEVLLAELGIKEYQVSPLAYKESEIWHPARTAQITKERQLIGVLGEIHPKILANFEIEKRAVVFNLDAVLLFELATTRKSYTPIPKYPAIVEDLCFVVKPKTQVEKLIRLIEQTSSIIRSVELTDSFRNQRTIRITYQHPKRNLKSKEVKKIRQRIIQNLSVLGSELKSD